MAGDMDEIDHGIIMRLENDARTPFSVISKELGTSVDTIRNRFRKLQRLGIVRGSTAVIRPEKLGYEVIVFFGVTVRPGSQEVVLDKIIKIPSIILATQTVGPHDVLAIGVAKNFAHLDSIVPNIRELPQVSGIHMTFTMGPMELHSQSFLL